MARRSSLKKRNTLRRKLLKRNKSMKKNKSLRRKKSLKIKKSLRRKKRLGGAPVTHRYDPSAPSPSPEESQRQQRENTLNLYLRSSGGRYRYDDEKLVELAEYYNLYRRGENNEWEIDNLVKAMDSGAQGDGYYYGLATALSYFPDVLQIQP
tara:strand:+ start:68 stop:523 length:456 start_codon:yes stop_codon:yes gene_type:complete